jgi:hypothetical protein
MHLLKRTEQTRREPEIERYELQPELISLEEETVDGYLMFSRLDGPGWDIWRRQQPYTLKRVMP